MACIIVSQVRFQQQQMLKLIQQFIISPQLSPLTWSDVSQMIAATLRIPGTQPASTLYYTGPQPLD